ncbi:MAG TPA: putative selenate reductase subunit YgfK [Lentisphaeria bacterium]|nr:MAG: putative selenate reductase subunit YgfK [Lentisphaerae bacterium GWF2_38_69]HBM16610.1 putative selenate reductase subunit YgfK [Lentisphaeria bacterium]
MSDKFLPISMESLTNWIFTELEEKNSIFGINRELFFKPKAKDKFKVDIYATQLETPFGVAAGPHTQMAQNLITAWLSGARFLELKTIQTLDELKVSKPCIDMMDAGFNVEWSQELKIKQSFDEYIRAWVLIYALHHKLGFPGKIPGVIFNTSIGYNYEGIQKDNVQWFLKKIRNAGSLRDEAVETVSKYYPEIKKIDIPYSISNNITLSTMHGCPPDEIGKIATYLITDLGFNTNVKLNPTLLGPDMLRNILNKSLGYREITVPDIAFEHDLKYSDAVAILKDLIWKADKKKITFGVKLTNTLEVENHKNFFDKKEKMMYMSGRPLHAISVNVAKKLSNEFNGELLMSFAGGADCYNAAELLSSGLKTITVSSDVLRPGGYCRIIQYIKNVEDAMESVKASSISDYITRVARKDKAVSAIKNPDDKVTAAALSNLNKYADSVISDPLYMRDSYERKQSKTSRKLEFFDCIKAPCTDECPVNQKAPQYIEAIKDGNLKKASEIMREDNPIPNILGRACNHQCETTCTRSHYDEPIAIRELKRYITDNVTSAKFDIERPNNVKVAVIGAGPCGLSTGYFLAQKGFGVTLFEEKDGAAGMVYQTIPKYRATSKSINMDVNTIKKLGVKIESNKKAGRDFQIKDLKKQGYKYIVVAAGAQEGITLGIPGENAHGVIDGISFLRTVKRGEKLELGASVGVIGAGDVAMDCARSANRITGGKVSVIYRRTIEEMPSHKEELDALLEEGIEIIELTAPKAVIAENGIIKALKCSKMTLGERDDSGRRKPVEIPNSDFSIPLDTLIMAIGQKPNFDFLKDLPIVYNKKGYIDVDPKTMQTSIFEILAGGDAIENGPLTIVKAAGDGKKIAVSIAALEAKKTIHEENISNIKCNYKTLMKKRMFREFRVPVQHLSTAKRETFDEIVATLSDRTAKKEAERCLQCHKFCSTCTTVCPNKAIFTYKTQEESIKLPVIKISLDKTTLTSEEIFKLAQSYQTAIFTPFCNECGTCHTFCPTSGSPYKDKPRFYLDKKEFDAENNNAFMLCKSRNGTSIQAKFDGILHSLSVAGTNIFCSNETADIKMSKNFSILECNAKSKDSSTLSMKNFAIMYVLLKNVKKSMPGMPFAQI